MKKLLIIALLVVGCDYAPTEHTHEHTHEIDCWSGNYSNHDELMEAVKNGYITVTRSASLQSECEEGEKFFWCQQSGTSTDDYDYCGNNEYCPVNDVNGVPCCYCGGCLVSDDVCSE